MAFQIVTTTASVVQAPAPSNLQQTGAFVTQGGSTVTEGDAELVSTLAELEAILADPLAITSAAWSANVVTLTTTDPHGWGIGDVVKIVVAGFTPTEYNGNFDGTITGTTTLTYPLTPDPGADSVQGTVALWATTELLQMGTTYFAAPGVPGVYVVELGEGEPDAGVAALTTFIAEVNQTSDQIYAYLVPREWDNVSEFLTLCGNATAVNDMLYFWVTTTYANRAVYSGPGYKSVYAEVESPDIGDEEFSLASAFGTALNASPSSTNKLPPLSYAPSYGTTAYPTRGNQTVFTQLDLNSVGWIGTGAQGGISGNIVFQGKMSDGNFWNFWYSVDWAQINMSLAIANEVINGSATTVNPLYYNQNGIDRLQNRVLAVARQGVTAGLGNGQVIATKLPIAEFLANFNAGLYAGQIVVNAEPFSVYTAENPSDYGVGRYAGLSAIWVPQLPFLNVYFDLLATTLVTG